MRLLDRRGGRSVLGAIATQVVRHNSREDISITYSAGLWTRRVGEYYLPDGRKFKYVYSDFGAWKREIEWREADAREFWLRHYRPKEGDVIFDVGAGRGEDILTFSRTVGRAGRVIAIEADPVSFAYLRSFCRLNKLENTVPLHVAAMDKPGLVRIREGSSWTENSIRVGDDGVAGAKVRADTIDAICCNLGVEEIAFLKMNIEGAERYALKGMRATMPRVRQLCVACHDFRADEGDGDAFRTRGLVEDILRQNGFSLDSRPDDPRPYVREHLFGLR